MNFQNQFHFWKSENLLNLSNIKFYCKSKDIKLLGLQNIFTKDVWREIFSTEGMKLVFQLVFKTSNEQIKLFTAGSIPALSAMIQIITLSKVS